MRYFKLSRYMHLYVCMTCICVFPLASLTLHCMTLCSNGRVCVCVCVCVCVRNVHLKTLLVAEHNLFKTRNDRLF